MKKGLLFDPGFPGQNKRRNTKPKIQEKFRGKKRQEKTKEAEAKEIKGNVSITFKSNTLISLCFSLLKTYQASPFLLPMFLFHLSSSKTS